MITMDIRVGVKRRRIGTLTVQDGKVTTKVFEAIDAQDDLQTRRVYEFTFTGVVFGRNDSREEGYVVLYHSGYERLVEVDNDYTPEEIALLATKQDYVDPDWDEENNTWICDVPGYHRIKYGENPKTRAWSIPASDQ